MHACVFSFAVSGAAAVSASSISNSRRRGVLGLQIEASAPYRVLNISELMNEHGNIINDAVNIAGKPKYPLTLKPKYPLTLKPKYPLTLKPKYPLTLKPKYPLTLKPKYPLTLKPKYPLTLKHPQLSSTQHTPCSSQSHIPISTAALLEIQKCCLRILDIWPVSLQMS
jgi:hypothetical protein